MKAIISILISFSQKAIKAAMLGDEAERFHKSNAVCIFYYEWVLQRYHEEVSKPWEPTGRKVSLQFAFIKHLSAPDGGIA